MGWKQIVTGELRKLEKNATPRERGAAMKRASAIYRGRSTEIPVRSNPGGGLVRMAVYGAVAYFGYKALTKKPAVTTEPAIATK
jgi:hypothetical protein